MGQFSDDMTAVGLELLTELGQAVTCHRENTSSFDPATGEVEITSVTDYTAYGYPSNYKLSQVDGTLVQQGDILLILSSSTEPAVDDTCEIGQTYTMLNIQKITAQGSDVIYKIQLRR